ncbi:HpcH/HpaI aldolase/citrate lyase family protein [Aspergillus flavus]|nr:HpcH/HpaI aldolase/citrate lyase family protein [Aspergillus flavus]
MASLESDVKALLARELEVPIHEVTTTADLKKDLTVNDLGKSQMINAIRERFDVYIEEEDTDQLNTSMSNINWYEKPTANRRLTFATAHDVIKYVETKLWWYSL